MTEGKQPLPDFDLWDLATTKNIIEVLAKPESNAPLRIVLEMAVMPPIHAVSPVQRGYRWLLNGFSRRLLLTPMNSLLTGVQARAQVPWANSRTAPARVMSP